MHYWNQENFEGLEAIAQRAVVYPQLRRFAEYCRLRVVGRRKPALAALRTFISEATHRPLVERQQITRWLLEVQLESSNVHQLLPYPLREELLKPTIVEWLRFFPSDAEPHRLHGYLFGDLSSYRRAIEIDGEDSLSRRFLITQLMGAIDYSTHHLSEGIFLGRTDEIIFSLEEVAANLARLAPDERRDRLSAWFEEQRQMVTDWIEYQSTPEGSFVEWLIGRGRDYRWPKTYYYDE